MKKNGPGCCNCATARTCTPCSIPYKNLTLTYSYTSTVDGTTKTFSLPLTWNSGVGLAARWNFPRTLFPNDSARGTTGCNWIQGALSCDEPAVVGQAAIRYFTYTANSDASICGTAPELRISDLTVGQFVCSPYMVKFPDGTAFYPNNVLIVTDP